MSMAFIPTKGIISPPTPYIIKFKPSNLDTEDVERNLTPLKDSGIKRGITMALKMTADNTALAGVESPMMFKMPS